ncbi:MAG: pentapeptide repeat-containing protein [Deltaproteobacteria bacterium]|nr:pentapeptide repeat-containing protein [Deltaproteobacteria bacterium]
MGLPLDAEDEDFVDLDLSEERLERHSFVGCTFKRCRFSGTRLVRWTLDDCRFEDCDLSVAKLGDSTLRDVHFVGCKLTGINWAEAHGLTLSIRFTQCTLNYGSFLDLPLRRLTVEGGTAADVQFGDCDLRDARFDKANLAGASFVRCDLRGADFSGSEGVALDPTCRFAKTKLGLDDALGHLHRLGIAVALR